MKKNLYDVLQVSSRAESEIIEAAYSRLKEKLDSRPDQEAHNELKFVEHAYATLSNPQARARYDEELAAQAPAGRAPISRSVEYKSDTPSVFMDWWASRKTSAIIVAGILLGSAILFLNYQKDDKRTGVAKEKLRNEKAKIEATAANEGGRVSNERVFIDRSMDNQANYIERSAETANRHVDVASQAESRHSRDLEYRANAGSQILDMRRKDQEVRHQELEYQRQLRERDLEIRRGQQQAEADRKQLIATYISDRRYAEALELARTQREIDQINSYQRQAASDQQRAQKEQAYNLRREQRERRLYPRY